MTRAKSQLEQTKIELDSKLRGLQYNLSEEAEKRKNAEMLYNKTKEQLARKDEQYSQSVLTPHQGGGGMTKSALTPGPGEGGGGLVGAGAGFTLGAQGISNLFPGGFEVVLDCYFGLSAHLFDFERKC